MYQLWPFSFPLITGPEFGSTLGRPSRAATLPTSSVETEASAITHKRDNKVAG